MIPEVLLITGDFNFHVDCPTEADAKKFADLMNTFGLIQHVHVPTHSSGHTLDLIITRSINDVTITSPLATFAFSQGAGSQNTSFVQHTPQKRFDT